ncbi:endolytic transglycosylase MltG [Camelliibacillus cellulosilyticus]|uniref:Endolytic transglycosylase MltG n=1 Tax=Camelliibacillus cellulosilyticus TaxID=2174486 RepID=A0ABV9GM93_9BACL
MTKHGMRGFAAGIIVTTAVVGLFYFQFMPSGEAKTASSKVTESSVAKYLEKHNQIAVDKTTYDRLQAADTQINQQNNNQPADKSSDKASDQNKKSDDKKQVQKVKVAVKEGMTTSDVADDLQKKHIIKDKQALIDYVIKNKLEPYLQLGTYTISSDMSIADIAKAITKKK